MFEGTEQYIIVGPGYLEAHYLGNTYCLGYTLGGIGIQVDVRYADLTNMATLGFYERKKIFEDVAIRATLLETTLDNLSLVWANYSTPTGTCLYGGDSTDLPEIQLKFIGPGPNCNRRELTVWKCVSYETGEMLFSKEAPTSIHVVFRGIMDMGRELGKRLYQLCDFDEDFNLLMGVE